MRCLCLVVNKYQHTTVLSIFLYLVKLESIRRVEEITGKKISYYSVNLLDKNSVKDVFCKVMYH